MAINETDLYDLVYDAMISYSTGGYKDEKKNPQHMKIMGEKMKEYFEENTIITYGWKAANPSGAADPIQSFVSEVDFPAFDITEPVILEMLATKIMAAFQGAKIKHPEAWQIPEGTFLIKPLVLPPSGSSNIALLKSIIRPVCVWVKTLINPVPLSGVHGAFSGASTGMVIV